MSKMKGASLEQAMPKPSKSETDYQTEDNMRTMHQASAIAADPVQLKKVHKLAGRKHKALMGMLEPMMKPKGPKIKSLQDLKDVANADHSKKGQAEDDGDLD